MIFGKVHIHTTEVPFHLVDAGHAVYHANYLILLDQARSQALQQAGYSAVELWNDGFALALYENTSRYLRPATYGQKISIFTTMLSATGTTLKVQQHIVPSATLSNDLLASGFFPPTTPVPDEKMRLHTAALTLVCVKLNPLRPTRIP
jgi:YbgC/YbaW family acyl-CoA thioester hydrolase